MCGRRGRCRRSAPSRIFRRLSIVRTLTRSATEDPKRPPVQGSNDALFSERVALWLDEGDRLDVEVAAAPPAPGEHQPSDQGRVRRLFARHRLGVVAGMGLLPLALFLSLHRGSAPPSVPAAAIVAAPASITPPSQPIAPAPAAVAP